MARIDALYLEDPCSGNRRMVDDLGRDEIPISRDRVRNLMRGMGIPLRKDFLYLVAIVDLFSRNVLSWRLSNSLDKEFSLDVLEMALEGGRKPEVFHSDQGCKFTSSDFVSRLQAEEIKISWSGRTRWHDNILVERLWRTVKYEEIYPRAYSDGWEAEISLDRFLWRYCHLRPHSSLGGRTPHEVNTETEPCSSRPGLTMSGA